uniref:Uncharacterized protein n=1 Tax=Oryza glumipatula TaxID=40148 RepID=A0A0E0A969_9ORYZ
MTVQSTANDIGWVESLDNQIQLLDGQSKDMVGIKFQLLVNHGHLILGRLNHVDILMGPTRCADHGTAPRTMSPSYDTALTCTATRPL